MTFYTHTSSDGLRGNPWCARNGMRRAHRMTTEVFIKKFKKKELSTTKTPASLPKSFLNKASGLDLEDSWGVAGNNTTLCSRNKYLKGRGEQGAVLVILGALVRSRGVPSLLKDRTRRFRSKNIWAVSVSSVSPTTKDSERTSHNQPSNNNNKKKDK